MQHHPHDDPVKRQAQLQHCRTVAGEQRFFPKRRRPHARRAAGHPVLHGRTDHRPARRRGQGVPEQLRAGPAAHPAALHGHGLEVLLRASRLEADRLPELRQRGLLGRRRRGRAGGRAVLGPQRLLRQDRDCQAVENKPERSRVKWSCNTWH